MNNYGQTVYRNLNSFMVLVYQVVKEFLSLWSEMRDEIVYKVNY